jgi:hypothetical protein
MTTAAIPRISGQTYRIAQRVSSIGGRLGLRVACDPRKAGLAVPQEAPVRKAALLRALAFIQAVA